MRHRVAHRKLGRVTEHRIALLRNQAEALLRHERIETTVPRAKELRPFVERIITVAKRDLKAGQTLDGIGGFTVYGVMENSGQARAEDLLPQGLSDLCVLVNDVAKDHPELVVDTLAAWMQEPATDLRMVSHALRTLVKRGDPGALAVLGFTTKPEVAIA